MDNEKKTQPFQGFTGDPEKLVRLPEGFFTEVLPKLSHIEDFHLLLYMFWHLEQQENAIRYLRREDLTGDPTLMAMIGTESALTAALDRMVDLGVVLEGPIPWLDETIYFINGPQGRAAIQAIERGEWQHTSERPQPIHLTPQRPNIFKLYEDNIGPITPMLAEVLKEDEAAYPAEWIEEAIRIALTRNARNWKYIQAILKRWKVEGRGNEQNRRDDSQDPGSYRESWLGKD